MSICKETEHNVLRNFFVIRTSVSEKEKKISIIIRKTLTCERGINFVNMHASIVWRITRDISVDLLHGAHQNQN